MHDHVADGGRDRLWVEPHVEDDLQPPRHHRSRSSPSTAMLLGVGSGGPAQPSGGNRLSSLLFLCKPVDLSSRAPLGAACAIPRLPCALPAPRASARSMAGFLPASPAAAVAAADAAPQETAADAAGLDAARAQRQATRNAALARAIAAEATAATAAWDRDDAEARIREALALAAAACQEANPASDDNSSSTTTPTTTWTPAAPC
ncbi:testis-specific gene A8 protein-like [Setaria italica]|uniref:testis-specific gene A8 protein-like n=1 Tax=Setaria italica TaxID=4555 RepID=UPI0003510D16|nr:testis-specific gene A8 protein-like [Setaria italica]